MSSSSRVIGDYIITSKIGSGSFATVYKAHHRTSHVIVAIKCIQIEKLTLKLQENLTSEISIMQKINHPNIIKLYEIKKTEKTMYLIMEYADGGDLHMLIKRKKRIDEKEAQRMFRELAHGLSVLWKHHLIHRDLKPQNLLLSEKENGTVKIADFGFARHLASAALAETQCGSPLYMAPEILKGNKYDAKADLWSVGTILFEMVVGKPPFNGANQFQLQQNIEKNELRFPEKLSASSECIGLLQALLRRNPMQRISYADFFTCAFVSINPEIAASLIRSEAKDPCTSAISIPKNSNAALHGGKNERTRNHSYSPQSPLLTSPEDDRRPNSLSTRPHIRRHYSTPSGGYMAPPASAPNPRTSSFKTEFTKPPLSAKATSVRSSTSSHRSRGALRFPPVVETDTAHTSSPEEYVLIDYRSTSRDSMVSKATTPGRSLPPLELGLEDTFNYICTVGTQCKAIVELGDRLARSSLSSSTSSSHSVEDSKSCLYLGQAFSLYLRALRLLDHAISTVQCTLASNAPHHDAAQELMRGSLSKVHRETALSLKLKNAYLWLIDRLGAVVDRVEQCASTIPKGTECLNCGDDLLYSHALRIGREAAVQEVLGQWNGATNLYTAAKGLLESLLLMSNSSSTSLNGSMPLGDKEAITTLIDGLSSRLLSIATTITSPM